MRALAVAALLLAGCAAGALRSTGAGSPLPAPGAAGHADAGGDADFRAVAHKAFAGDPHVARAEIESFLAHHPDHPNRLGAVALLARVYLGEGNPRAALATIGALAPGADTADLRFVSALADVRIGQGGRAHPVLLAFQDTGPPLVGGMVDPDGAALLAAGMAEALLQTGDPAGAIDQWDRYLGLDGVRQHERAFAKRRAEEIAAPLSAEAALAALSVKRSPMARSTLGAKAAQALRARGDEAGASRLEQDTGAVRRSLALDPSLAAAGPGDPRHLGLAIPLSGPRARLGEVVLRGAALVIGTSPYRLVVRDSAATPDRAPGGVSGAIWALAREESAIGIVGTPDPRGLELAKREGLPLLLLDEKAPGGHTTAFQLVHSSELRATALAQRALGLGARRFAILGPDTSSSRRLAAAFSNRMTAGGGAVSAQIVYPAKATSFASQIEQLRKSAFDVLFVADDAARLELIAPALAVADIWPRQPRMLMTSALASRATSGRREVFLMSTALSLSQRLLKNAERYVQGAMLCPGYYPAEDAHSGSFATQFRDVYGVAPTAADAYGHDGVAIVRDAVERGAKTRADVLRLLQREVFQGVTGDIRFGADHGRIDPPRVYVVEGDTIRTLR